MKMKSWAAGVVGALVLALTPGTANAADSGSVRVGDTDVAGFASGTCDKWNYYSKQKWERHDRYGGLLRAKLTAKVTECGSSYWNVTSARGQVYRSKRDCNLLDYIEMNPDAIGGRNLFEKTRTCEDGNRRDVARWDFGGGIRVQPNDTSDEKCLGMDIDLDHRRGGLGFPDEHFDLGAFCLTLHS